MRVPKAQDDPRPTGMALTLLNYARHAMKVLGTGHQERIYHKALATSLGRSNITFRSELVTPIMYMGECIGIGRADLVVQGSASGPRQPYPDLVIEIKANAKCPSQASGQLRKYMESLRSVERRECTGVVLNFNQTTGQVEMHLEAPAEPRPKPVPAPSLKCSRFFQAGPKPGPKPGPAREPETTQAFKRCKRALDPGPADSANELTTRLHEARDMVRALESQLGLTGKRARST